MVKKFYTTGEVATMLGVSRIAIFKKIKSGELKAEKIGRSYAISAATVRELLGETVGTERRQQIEQAVRKTVMEYGEALKRLGDE